MGYHTAGVEAAHLKLIHTHTSTNFTHCQSSANATPGGVIMRLFQNSLSTENTISRMRFRMFQGVQREGEIDPFPYSKVGEVD